MRLRFSIRDLLWLTLVVALVLGWWLEHRMWVSRDYFFLQTYSTKTTDPKLVLKVLQTMLAGVPDVKLELDDTSKAIVILARPRQQEYIRQVIEQLDAPHANRGYQKLEVPPQSGYLSTSTFC